MYNHICSCIIISYLVIYDQIISVHIFKTWLHLYVYMFIDVHIWTCLCAWHIYIFPVSGAYDVYDQFSSLYLVNKPSNSSDGNVSTNVPYLRWQFCHQPCFSDLICLMVTFCGRRTHIFAGGWYPKFIDITIPEYAAIKTSSKMGSFTNHVLLWKTGLVCFGPNAGV